MSVEIEPLHAKQDQFAARVTGINIATDVCEEVASQIERALDKYAVLVFPNQRINDDQQYRFSTLFGPMETASGDIGSQSERRLSMNVNDISNLDTDGQVLERNDRARLFGLGNMLWHSDSSFKSTPAKYSLLSARVIPEHGGNTEFADMRSAWDSLAPELQRECMNLTCEHSQIYSRGKLGFEDFTEEERAKWKPVLQRLVRRHPNTGRLSLYLSSHIGAIVDLPVPEARLFISDLTEHATRPANVYTHSWRKWDLVMWDNRVTMHRARRYDHTSKRDLHRTTVSDCGPTLNQPL
ncbi:2,4-dichlorophenoxyacetate dioxygenase [Chromatiales bacterium (ex Bugula neritina AB1)]|nr:2,4-dichlorophenoxyacetate dioxygenase [Chromatiales bacterium (ex Bugula neritina AB1)]